MPVLDHVRERLALLHLAAEGEEGRPHRVVELGVGHHHVEDRLRLRRDRVPDLDRLEQPPRRGRDRRGARVLRLRGRQAPDRPPSPRTPRPAPGAARSPAPGRQSRRRRSPRRFSGAVSAPSASDLPALPCKISAQHSRLSQPPRRHWRQPASKADHAMTSAVQDLLNLLDLEPLEVEPVPRPLAAGRLAARVRRPGDRPGAGRRRAHGRASRPPHSMHAYFLLPGDPKVPIIYDVDRIRDGKSFTTRRVTARQHGHPIFSMLVSFHTDEPGLDHQAKMPDVPPPEKLPSEAEMREKILPTMPDPVRRYYERERPIELRPVEFERYLGKKYPDGQFQRLDQDHRPAARRSGDPSMRAGLRLRHDAARHRAGAARPHAVRKGIHGRQPRSCAVAAPAVPRRRLAALCAGFAQSARLARLRRADLSSPATARWSPRWRRKAWCASGATAAERDDDEAIVRCVGSF